MKKINISTEIKELHKDYFIQKIQPQLAKEVTDANYIELIRDITSSDDLTKLGINSLFIADFKIYFKRSYKRFFKFINKKETSTKIAIGDMDKLFILDKLLKKKHKFFIRIYFQKIPHHYFWL